MADLISVVNFVHEFWICVSGIRWKAGFIQESIEGLFYVDCFLGWGVCLMSCLDQSHGGLVLFC